MKTLDQIIEKLAKSKGYPHRKLSASEYIKVLEDARVMYDNQKRLSYRSMKPMVYLMYVVLLIMVIIIFL